MNLVEFINELGGWAVITIAISVFISKWIQDKNQSKYNENLEVLKNSFQSDLSRYRQYNDISKETYQKLFDEKISTYQKLNKILHEYKSKTYESSEHSWAPGGKYNEHEQAFLDLSYEMKKIINGNQLVISDEVSEKYKDIYNKQAPYFLRHNVMSSDPDSVDPADYNKLLTELKSESEKDMLGLTSLVETDISDLRKYLSGY